MAVPTRTTAAVVSCLVAIAHRIDGAKRSAVLGALEELTCGRGASEYSAEQNAWYREAARELVCGLHFWVGLMETSSEMDAEQCVDLLA